MATEKQYEFFRYLYEQEEHRRERLDTRAQSYLTMISLYAAGLAVLWERAASVPGLKLVPSWVFLVSGVALLLSLLATMAGLHVRSYEGIVDPRRTVSQLSERDLRD